MISAPSAALPTSTASAPEAKAAAGGESVEIAPPPAAPASTSPGPASSAGANGAARTKPPQARHLTVFTAALAAAGNDPARAWAKLAAPVVRRVLVVRGYSSLDEAQLVPWMGHIWAQAMTYGFPDPLPEGEKGNSGTFREESLQPAVAAVLSALRLPERVLPLAVQFVLTKQLLRSLVAPPFVNCRLTYQKRDSLSGCSRQEPSVAQCRPSGAFCEDCPLFTSLTEDRHQRVLTMGWHGEQPPEASMLGALVPEDFRKLRSFTTAWLSFLHYARKQ